MPKKSSKQKFNKLVNIFNQHVNIVRSKNLTRFAAIDFEMYERAQHKILEVGVSLFETNSIITTHHLVIDDFYNIRNKKFVPDNKDNFNHGQSERIPLKQLGSRLTELLGDVDAIVTHGGKSDRKILRDLGCKINTTREIDTQHVFRVYSTELKQVSLGGMWKFLTFGQEAKNLHNAGNDSHVTAESFQIMFNDLVGLNFTRAEFEAELQRAVGYVPELDVSQVQPQQIAA